MTNCMLCNEPIAGRGLCKKHYYQMRRKGMLDSFQKKNSPIIQRMYEKIEISQNGCWNWTGNKNHSGYPLIWKNGKAVKAHREMFLEFNGFLNDSDVICHKCDNPACVNPDHLFAGTRLTNNRDAVAKGRNAFGEKNGHAVLSKQQVQAIKDDNRPQAQIAKEFGIHQSHVSKIKSGKRRKKG